MNKRRIILKSRRPIFLGCEGESEQAYGQLLNDLAESAGLFVHIEVVNLSPGAGDPISRLRRAVKEIDRRRVRRSGFSFRAVLLDSDQLLDDPQRLTQSEQFAKANDIHIIWQNPCHEALLLRHIVGFTQHRPPSSQSSQMALQDAWPIYAKPMTKIQLATRIGLSDVRKAANVEPGLAHFLTNVGLLP